MATLQQALYMKSFFLFIEDLHRGYRLLISLAVGLLVFFLVKTPHSTGLHFLYGWISFAIASLFFTWTTILIRHPANTGVIAREQDSSVWIIFLLVVTAAFISLFTIRYAHLYYNVPHKKKRDANEKNFARGLLFPGSEAPDFMDFAYFSFVLGMTFQVADVSITGRGIRRLALLHGFLSFVYNTAIIALSINIISGLIGSK